MLLAITKKLLVLAIVVIGVYLEFSDTFIVPPAWRTSLGYTVLLFCLLVVAVIALFALSGKGMPEMESEIEAE